MKKMRLLGVAISILTLMAACQPETHSSENKDTKDSTSTTSDGSEYYTEQHRPQIHFSPEANWMNDPNGMVFYEGEYHLFYQYYPDSNVWGPMHWAHAISKDLVHWEHLPIALYPDSLGLIFSGSAVIDKNNTSGFKSGEYDPMVAIYTYHSMELEKEGRDDFQTQGIAYSNDKGRTWTKYEGNPVIPNPGIRDFRDPKVIWHEASQSWVMVFAQGDRVRFYRSRNLKEWEFASEFGKGQGHPDGVWECPDLFPLEIDGDPENKKWVLILSHGDRGGTLGSGTEYFIGEFDGTTFTNDNSPETVLWLDYGMDNYAGVTWSDIPDSDGRRLFMGWMSNWKYATIVPTYIWRSAMTLPRSLSLTRFEDGIRLISTPIEELATLRGQKTELKAEAIEGKKTIATTSEPLEIQLAIDTKASTASEFGIRLSNSKDESLQIGYLLEASKLFVDRTNAGKSDFHDQFADKHLATAIARDGILELQIFIDKASVEVFAEDGEVVMTDIFFPNEDFDQVEFFAENGKMDVKSGTVYVLNSIWK